MTIDELKETAAMAHIRLDEGEAAGMVPVLTELLAFFDSMQAAEKDRAAFPEGLAPVSAALAGVFGNCRTVDSRFYQSAAPEEASGANISGSDAGSRGLGESLLDNAAERDGRFVVVPNVL